MFSPPGNDPVPELGGEKGKDLRGAVGGGSVLLEPVLPSGGPSPDGRPDYLFQHLKVGFGVSTLPWNQCTGSTLPSKIPTHAITFAP